MALKDRTQVRRPPSKDIAKLRERLQHGHLAPHAYVALLGLRRLDTVGLVDRIQAGLSYAALERFQRNIGLSNAELSALLQIPLRTLSRRKDEGRLQPDESDRLVRSARLFVRTMELFEGQVEEARTWLTSPNPALGGAVPLDLAATEVGAREIEAVIDRLEHGVVSQVITAWRILKAKHQEHAFDGEGARRAGGRWNSRGVPVVYCSAHVSLAALEVLVQLQAVGPLAAYVVIPVRFAERFVASIDVKDLPPNWGTYPAPSSLQALGDTCATSLRSLVLRVPSVVVPHEANYLLNPLHPNFKLLEVGPAEPFTFDVRLLES